MAYGFGPDGKTFLAFASVSVITYIVWRTVYYVYFHPLREFPGPFLAKFSRFPLIRSHFQGKTYKYVIDLHEQYGSIVRIAPDELATTELEAWKDIYQAKPQLPKDPLSFTPPLNGADTLFTAQGATHQRMRRTLANAFSDKALRQQNPIIQHYVDLFIERIERELQKSTTLDITKFYGFLSLDIIGDLSIGKSFHGLEGENEHSWLDDFWMGVTFGSLRTSLARFHPLELIFGFLFLRLTRKQRANNWKYVTDSITERLHKGSLDGERWDFLTPVIGNVNEGREEGITRSELDGNTLAMIIAGCEVSTVALSATTYFLLRNPSTVDRLAEEVRSSFQNEAEIDVGSTFELPYLNAIINEGLRMHHPTPSPLPRVVPSEGLKIAGQWIPGGAIIGICPQAIQTDKAHFNDPLSFNPERWLEESHKYFDERFRYDNREASKPFSVGPRNCIGSKLYLGEARVTFARLLFKYDIEMFDKSDSEWTDQKAFLIFKPTPLQVKLMPRGVQSQAVPQERGSINR
ncbi:cytochrome P450 monooxygenase-like protein [Hyaloscypha bicolor E]|uniref:Cytochrome P450 monooxygenase-like protein n=1 Tax=Hyaloscypha bicolor E TaxID=1095630 RepID=A0A2J6SXK3_9HELO|nr:cytochrome P450 monooxygenase-like protein [Hyaloscypha bicolor E]PMD55506.1 cytochrome P450 monooxygenase-like protein [Hyaloscypha bicolor E]